MDVNEPVSPHVEDPIDEPITVEEQRMARLVFVKAFSSRRLSDDLSFAELMLELDRHGKDELQTGRSEQSVRQALTKMHGDWYEWLLCIISNELATDATAQWIPLRLPNVARFDSINLYADRLRDMLADLRREVQLSDVELISSNPDFVLIRRALISEHRVSALSYDVIDWHESRYLGVLGKCNFDDIAGYLAAKYTLRPDRRLQMAHEGSLMKALYVHLQTRLWVTRPRGLKFYGVSTAAGPADIKGLKTVATHSITTVASAPQRAVDELFITKSVGDARRMFESIMR